MPMASWISAGIPARLTWQLISDTSTVTGILDRMENMYDKRIADPNDRRSIKVVLTEQGRAVGEPVTKVIGYRKQEGHCVL